MKTQTPRSAKQKTSECFPPGFFAVLKTYKIALYFKALIPLEKSLQPVFW